MLITIPPLPPEPTQEQITAALLREIDIIAVPFYKLRTGDYADQWWYKLIILTEASKEKLKNINPFLDRYDYCCTCASDEALHRIFVQADINLIIWNWR